MRRVILYSAVTLDGFIARSDGSVDWLEAPEYELQGEDFGYNEFYESVDTTIMGNETYGVTLGFDVPFPYPDKRNFVFTRNLMVQRDENVEFITGDIAGFVEGLKGQPGKDIWLIGGGQINSLLFQNGLIDRIILTQIPVLLGRGIPLFTANTEARFKITESINYPNGFIQQCMKPLS
jgi:dihydrofolate reductase